MIPGFLGVKELHHLLLIRNSPVVKQHGVCGLGIIAMHHESRL
jgi:hypothetical protein